MRETLPVECGGGASPKEQEQTCSVSNKRDAGDGGGEIRVVPFLVKKAGKTRSWDLFSFWVGSSGNTQ